MSLSHCTFGSLALNLGRTMSLKWLLLPLGMVILSACAQRFEFQHISDQVPWGDSVSTGEGRTGQDVSDSLISDMADAPDIADLPPSPDVSDVPDIADLPPNPDVSDVPDIADLPPSPDVSDVPDMADLPPSPDVSDVSDVSDVPDIADLPPSPDVSDVSDVSDPCLPGEGCFGDPCTDNADCMSGWCVWHMGARVCTDLCVDQCPAGWDCKEAQPGVPDTAHICLSDFALLCWPCLTELDCVSDQQQEFKCVGGLPAGSFCSPACSGDGQGDCPEGYECVDLADEAGKACRPKSGGCLCTAEAVDASSSCFAQNEYGKCPGSAVCNQADELPACNASIPSPEQCDGVDNDCNGVVDGEDSDGCTVYYMDSDGDSFGASGDSRCLCVPEGDYDSIKPGDCDDKNGGVMPGAGESCDKVDGDCDGALDDSDCSDGNECTMDWCDGLAGACVNFLTKGMPCTDGNICTGGETCQEDGWCGGGVPNSCDDSNVCTKDSCVVAEGGCVHVPFDEADCDDGDACTLNKCEKGNCLAVGPLSCDDSNPCTDDSCVSATGCQFEPNTASCKDGAPCTINDACSAGVCAGNPIAGCADDDWDNDGLPNKTDGCPYAFDPTNPDSDGVGGPDACEHISAHGLFMSKRVLDLKENGDWSSSRRTSEPLEVPLMTGYKDASVLGWWPMEGSYKDSGPYSLSMTAWFGELFGDGIVGAKSHHFDGKSIVACTNNPPMPSLAMSFSAWVRLNSVPADGKQMVLLMHAGLPGQQAGARVVKLINAAGKTYLSFWTWNGTWNQMDVPLELKKDTWMHLAATHDGTAGAAAIYLNGEMLKMAKGMPVPTGNAGSEVSEGGIYLGGARVQSTSVHMLDGYMDEALLLARVLQPVEIRAIHMAKTESVTSLVPGAQKDFDDVRVVETPHTGMEEPGDPYVTRTQILGARPHSDTPCVSAGAPDIVRHRDDLCGVAAYWPIDSNLKEVKSGIAFQCGGGGPSLDRGRFGDNQGALFFQTDAGACSAGDVDAVDPGSKSLTIELWVKRQYQPHNIVAYPLQKKGMADVSGYQVAVTLVSGLVSCEFFGGSGQTVSVKSLYGIGGGQFITDPKWVHVACVLDRDKKEVRSYLDGTLHNSAGLPPGFTMVANSSPLMLGEASSPNIDFTLFVDDVVIHDVVKSDDYIYNRANPGMPVVRFLANTVVAGVGTPAVFAARGYTLHWGNASAKLRQPFVVSVDGQTDCHGLLNPCLGYALWMRFDELWADWAVDSSQHRAWGKLLNYSPNEEPLTGAPGGAGLYLPAARGVDVSCGPQCGVAGPHTLEAILKPQKLPSTEDMVLVSRDKNGATEFSLGLSMNAPAGHVTATESAGMESCEEHSSDPLVPGEWQTAALVFDGGLFTVYANGTKSTGKSCMVTPGTDFSKLWIGDIDHPQSGDLKPFLGVIDSVRLMTRALTLDEMLSPVPLSVTYGPVQ